MVIELSRVKMTVLVLCHGSVCRSPLAVAIMKKYGLEDVRCAGFKPNGTKSPKKVRDWAAENASVSLEDHRSVEVSREMLKDSEWILFMDSGQKKRLAELWDQYGLTESRGNVEHFSEPLGRYLNDPKEKIGDPMFQAGGSQAFVEIMEQLVEASRNFVEQRAQAPIVAEA